MFRLKDYNRFLNDNAADIASFRTRQRRAFAEERERWNAAGQAEVAATAGDGSQGAGSAGSSTTEVTLADAAGSGTPVDAHISGSVWKVLVEPGQTVEANDPLLILESMKMEFTVTAPAAGKVGAIAAREGVMVTSGQTLLWME